MLLQPGCIDDDENKDKMRVGIYFHRADAVLATLQAGKALPMEFAKQTAHFDCLQNCLLAGPVDDDPGTSNETWAQCARILLSRGEPVGEGENSAASVFLTHFWDDFGAVASLCRDYLEAGALQCDYTAPGQLGPAYGPDDHPEDPGSLRPEGQRLLTMAIEYGRAELAVILVEYGANMELGPVVAGGPPREALEFAKSLGKHELHAAMTAAYMSRTLAENVGTAAHRPQTPSRRHRV